MDLRSSWRIVNGQGVDLSDRLRGHLTQIQVTDNPGRESDSARLTLHGANDLPQIAQALTIYMGDPLHRCGVYYVDEFEEDDTAETLDVVCRAVHFGGDVVGKGEAPAVSQEAISDTYTGLTLGDIGSVVARRLKLAPSIDPNFAGYTFGYLEQVGESDPSFIQRVAKEAGAIAKISGEALAIGTTHSGESFTARADLPNVTLTRRDVARGATSVGWSVRTVPSSVRAVWHNPKTGASGAVTASTGQPRIQLLQVFPDEKQAAAAASRRLDAAVRKRRKLSTTLATADTRIWAGSTLTLETGEWRRNFTGQWSTLRATHTISRSTASTSLTAELENG